jgi:hypothetical protein
MSINIDGKFLNHMRKEITEALTKVGEDNGMTLKIGNVRYDETGFHTKLTATVGDKEESERVEFEKNCMMMFDVTPDMYGQTFVNAGSTFKVVGLKPRSTKMPIVARNLGTDKLYKFKLHVLTKEKL